MCCLGLASQGNRRAERLLVSSGVLKCTIASGSEIHVYWGGGNSSWAQSWGFTCSGSSPRASIVALHFWSDMLGTQMLHMIYNWNAVSFISILWFRNLRRSVYGVTLCEWARESDSSKFNPKINLLSIRTIVSDFSSGAVYLSMASWFHADWCVSLVSPEESLILAVQALPIVSMVCCAVVG